MEESYKNLNIFNSISHSSYLFDLKCLRNQFFSRNGDG